MYRVKEEHLLETTTLKQRLNSQYWTSVGMNNVQDEADLVMWLDKRSRQSSFLYRFRIQYSNS